MKDYSNIGLTSNLTATGGLADPDNNKFVDAYSYRANTDMGAVSNYQVQRLSFNKLQGGTMVLGGTNNVSGLFELKDASGNIIIQGDNSGHHYYDTGANELIKVDESGFHAFGTGGTANEQIKVDESGFHAFGTGGTANEQIKVDEEGLHAYGTGGIANQLVKVDDEGLHCYLNDGSKSLKISGTTIEGYGTAGDSFNFLSAEGGTIQGQTGILDNSGTMSMYLAGLNGAMAYILGGGVQIQSADNLDITVQVGGDGGVNLKGGDTGEVDSSGVFVWNHDTSAYTEKKAILPTSQGFRSLYCTESPEVWFMDFCESKDKIDPLFLEVTEPPYHFIKCEEGEYQVWGKRRGLSHKRFEQKTEEEFKQNNQFWSMANVDKKTAK